MIFKKNISVVFSLLMLISISTSSVFAYSDIGKIKTEKKEDCKPDSSEDHQQEVSTVNQEAVFQLAKVDLNKGLYFLHNAHEVAPFVSTFIYESNDELYSSYLETLFTSTICINAP